MGSCPGRPLRSACCMANPQKVLVTECREPRRSEWQIWKSRDPDSLDPGRPARAVGKPHEAEPGWRSLLPPTRGSPREAEGALRLD